MTDAVPESWLRNDQVSDAERFDRLAGDEETLADLRVAGFVGPNYDHFENECARYGLAVIGGWVRRGLIYQRCQERGVRGVPRLPDGAMRDEHAAEEIAGETVRRALVTFRDKVLIPGRWDPNRGASLRTFFIGQCLFQYANVATTFLNVYRRDLELRDRLAEESNLNESTALTAVEDDVIQSEAARLALEGVGEERVRVALVMSAWKYTQAEIAEHLGVTPKAVERLLATYRQKLRKGGIA